MKNQIKTHNFTTNITFKLDQFISLNIGDDEPVEQLELNPTETVKIVGNGLTFYFGIKNEEVWYLDIVNDNMYYKMDDITIDHLMEFKA